MLLQPSTLVRTKAAPARALLNGAYVVCLILRTGDKHWEAKKAKQVKQITEQTSWIESPFLSPGHE
jgi:hypothetical protein